MDYILFPFLAGNKKSLVDAMEKGINLREQILKLYNDYYHGGLMKLVVIGGGKHLFSLFGFLVLLLYDIAVSYWRKELISTY